MQDACSLDDTDGTHGIVTGMHPVPHGPRRITLLHCGKMSVFRFSAVRRPACPHGNGRPHRALSSIMSSPDRSLPEAPDAGSLPPDSPPEPVTRIPLRIEDVLTVLIMVSLALITFGNVVVRYFTSASFAWTEEISVFLMVVLTMVAGSAAFARHRHVRIELLADRGSPGWQRFAARFGTAMVILLFGMMTVLGSLMVWDEFEFGETSPGIGVPQWWYTIWLPVFSALITLRAMGLYIRQSRQPASPAGQAEVNTEPSSDSGTSTPDRQTGTSNLTGPMDRRPSAVSTGSFPERRPS